MNATAAANLTASMTFDLHLANGETVQVFDGAHFVSGDVTEVAVSMDGVSLGLVNVEELFDADGAPAYGKTPAGTVYRYTDLGW